MLRAAARYGIPIPAVEEDLLGGDVEVGARRLRGALMRAIQMTGAMDAAVDLTARHAGERRQRSVGNFARQFRRPSSSSRRMPPPKRRWPGPRPTRR